MKVRLLIISVFLGLAGAAFAGDIPGKECNNWKDCQDFQKCLLGHCLWLGIGIDESGCCYKKVQLIAGTDIEGERYIPFTLCDKEFSPPEVCAWDSTENIYLCVKAIDNQTTFNEDPSGKHPRECDFTCYPRCEGKECGSDWCGGTCGKCGQGQVCTKEGKCCTPNCDGKDCGPDGCGGSCGECKWFEECTYEGKCTYDYGCKEHGFMGCPDCACEECVCKLNPDCCNKMWSDFNCTVLCRDECGGCRECVPDCSGKECGSDGCRGSCGSCKVGKTCYNGKCVENCPCGARECGKSPCGDECGKCASGQICTKDGKCKACTPDCTGKDCGSDGCGGLCGKCKDYSQACVDGKCEKCDESTNYCEDWWDCGMDECGHECGDTCMAGECIDHTCYYGCIPYCDGFECGDDGCEGSCGKCGSCEQCIGHQCKPIPDCEVPEPVPNVAEDVHAADVIEVVDPGQAKDTVPDTATKSGGSCATGTGPASGIFLILLMIFSLFSRRRQGKGDL